MKELTLQQRNSLDAAQVKVCRVEAVVDLIEHYLIRPSGESAEGRLEKASEVMEMLSEEVQELKELLMNV